MKKVFLTIIFTVVICLIAIPAFAQIGDTDLDNINKGVESGFAILIGLLVKKYPFISLFSAGIISLIMALIRKIEKTGLKNAHANELQAIVDEATDHRVSHLSHVSKLKAFINKLRGHEVTDETTK